jgi:hypothetical protein
MNNDQKYIHPEDLEALRQWVAAKRQQEQSEISGFSRRGNTLSQPAA